MDAVRKILQKKSPFFLLVTIVYLLLVACSKWTIHPTVNTLLFLAGGIIGIYFLDVAEAVFNVSPSPFRSIVFVLLFALVGFFVVTSSGSFLASGLVLSMFLTIVLWQAGEWAVVKNLNSWYRILADPVPVRAQLWIFIGLCIVFFMETFFFIRS